MKKCLEFRVEGSMQNTGWKTKKDMVRECRSGYDRT